MWWMPLPRGGGGRHPRLSAIDACHCEEQSDEAIQHLSTDEDWIASLRSQ
jgi:hypothetical protein